VTPRRIWRGQLYALAAMAFWSTNYVIGRYLRAEVSPATIAAFRSLVAGVPLGLWFFGTGVWRTDRGGAQPGRASGEGAAPPALPIRSIIGPFVALGALGIFGSQYLTYLALHWSLATNAIILNAASPLVTAGMAVTTGVSAFSRGLFGGLAISVIGAALVTGFGGSGVTRLEWDPGALLVIASMFTWALYNLGVQRLSLTLPPVAITAGAMLAGFPFLLIALAVERPPHLLATVRTHLPVQALASALIIGGILVAFRSLTLETGPGRRVLDATIHRPLRR
jgi:drug/metabolite transporter (DMT)-like permease